MRTIVIDEADEYADGYHHIPNAPDLSGAPAQTLCGWTDVPQRDSEPGTEPDCPECLIIVAYCKRLDLRLKATKGTGKKRPYKVGFTEHGTFAQTWASYSTPKTALRGLAIYAADPTELGISLDGWFIAYGPGMEQKTVGVGDKKDQPFPEFYFGGTNIQEDEDEASHR